ncbi:cupin domain-containing protein [Pendulispora albinea]|uniref:Cupin domain-containing protein n=1 Tax=Pendulispora albinea TaxID=2741071 RepID=A0ABZ2LVX0_9BACT
MKNVNKNDVEGTSFNIAAAFGAMADSRRLQLLGDFALESDAMLGVIRLGREKNGAWERHDGGDEMLMILEGRVTMTLRREGAPDQTHHVGAGDTLLIPKGVAHSGMLHTDEVRVFFITPREGNHEWTDHPDTEGHRGSEFATVE